MTSEASCHHQRSFCEELSFSAVLNPSTSNDSRTRSLLDSFTNNEDMLQNDKKQKKVSHFQYNNIDK